MPGIVIATGHHPCRNPRVLKEAVALAGAGYEVEVHAPVFSDELLALDEGLAGYDSFRRVVPIDLRTGSRGKRLKRRLAMEAVAWLRLESAAAIGYGVDRHLDAAGRTSADIVIGHQEIGTWVAAELATEGRRIGADFEDWYTEDLLPAARRFRPLGLLRKCERQAMNCALHLTTTSKSLARALHSEYGGRLPVAVYNAFPLQSVERIDTNWDGPLRAVWFSQRVGPGRGLETIVRAMAHTRLPINVTFVGLCDTGYKSELTRLAGPAGAERLLFRNPVPPDELPSLVAGYDLGFAFEQTEPPSRNLTVTNKILMYLAAGLAVVATPTAGQAEVAGMAEGAISICAGGDATVLAKCIDELAGAPDRLLAARRAALRAAAEIFCWERQREVLLESVEEALKT